MVWTGRRWRLGASLPPVLDHGTCMLHVCVYICLLGYSHHYFPALYFAIIVMSHLLDHVLGRVCSRFMKAVMLNLVIVAIVVVFWYFSPFVYGFVEKFEGFENRRWLSTWKF
jgi:dolichyl-phosphate-mannose--protein O-mannosyl transferase